MSLTAAEQEAMAAFVTGIQAKQQQNVDDEDVLFFDIDTRQMEDNNPQQKYETTHNDSTKHDESIRLKQEPEITQTLPQISRESGYYAAQQRKPPKKVSKMTAQDLRPKNKLMGLIDNEDDVGEVGEWIEHTAQAKQGDDDFDVFDEPPPKQNDFEAQREKINQKLQKHQIIQQRQGPIVNNLKEKAKTIAQNNNTQPNPQKIINPDIHHFSDNEGDSHDEAFKEEEIVDAEKSSPNKKIFQLPKNSIERKLSSRVSLEPQEQDAQDIWEQVNKDRLEDLQNKPKVDEIKKIIYIDAWDQLKSNREIRNSVMLQRQNSGSFIQKMFGCFSVHIKSTKLEDEINQILSISETTYNETSQLHFQIIHTIYCTFVNTDFCARYGLHWESIGFQGRDPSTDLRSVGVFGLLQILAFLNNYQEYIKDCLEATKQPQSQIPLCITLFNITLFCLTALKEKRMHSMINKEDSALTVINKIYFAGWFFFFEKFKSMGGTFDSIGVCLLFIKNTINSNPQKLVQDFKKAIELYYKTRSN